MSVYLSVFSAAHLTWLRGIHRYVRIVELAAATGQIATITGQLSRLDSWMAEWSCTTEERRSLYKQLFYSLKESGNLKQSCE